MPLHQRREARAVDRTQVEQRASPRAAIARATTSRGASSSTKRSPSLVDEQRAVAAQRLGQQQRRAGERRRVELHELEIGDRRARAVRHRDALADGAGRVRRALPERGVAAGREQHGARAAIARASVTRPTQRPSDIHSSSARSRSLTSMRGCASTASREDSRDLASRLRAADAVTRARREWPPSSPSSSSKRTPRSTRSTIRAGASCRQRPHGALAAEAAAGGERVRGVELRARRRPRSRRRCRPARASSTRSRTGPFETIKTRPSAAAQSAP